MNSQVFDCFTSSERGSKAVARILAKKYDTDSWNMLIKEAANENIDSVEPFYEELIKTFPTCGRYWRSYIEHELRLKRYDKASKLFARSLEEVLSIDLYKCYLNFVRETKAAQPELVFKAFRFTLDKIGIDPNAISIYNDYIQFLKEREIDSQYTEGRVITAVRKAYQEGIVNPMFHIDTLWKEYISFEQSMNTTFAEKALQDRSREHMNARRVAKEWEVIIRGLNRSWPAVPPSLAPDAARQLEIWRRYVQWEKSNPLRDLDNTVVVKRVIYAYKQWILCFGHHPNVWHEYANYLEEQIRSLNDKENELSKRLVKEELSMFERATKGLMKHNLLIQFSYADFEELRNDRKKALEIYTNLIESARENDQIDVTLVYIQLMRFTRRSESLKAARAIFKRARDDSRCTYHIYTAAAHMEYNCTKDQAIACKIFELGLKKFATCLDYILSYIHFMNSLNEENNTRVLFERILKTSSLPTRDTIEIWNSFLEFEAGIGDLSSITKVERRRAAALEKEFPNSTETSWAVEKYRFQDLYPCSLNELRSIGYESGQSVSSLRSIKELMLKIDSFQGPIQARGALAAADHVKGKRTKLTGRVNRINGTLSVELVDQGDSEQEFPLNIYDQTSMCLPDLDQMLPFKPVMAPGFGSHTVSGGVFPPPPAVANLMSRLPQPGAFWGPFVDIDELCNIVTSVDFDALFNNLVEQRRETNKQPRPKKARMD